MSLVPEQFAFLLDVAKLINFIEKENLVATAGEVYRTPEQQDIYFKQGKSKTRNSNHLKRLAIDLNFFKDGKLTYDLSHLETIGRYWESLNSKNRAGMFWKFRDVPHFERNIQEVV